jgi:hypothetical protein
MGGLRARRLQRVMREVEEETKWRSHHVSLFPLGHVPDLDIDDISHNRTKPPMI